MDKQIFFDKIRKPLFAGKLTNGQVEGMEMILNVWDMWVSKGKVDNDLRKLAYIFATSYHETGTKMQAVKEIGKGANRPYGVPDPVTGLIYYGRGDVQLTWPENYKRMGKILGIDLYNNPELALVNDISKQIMFEGMLRGESRFGDFSGKSMCLENFFNDKVCDPYNARRIINKLDRAKLIESYYNVFLSALQASFGK